MKLKRTLKVKRFQFANKPWKTRLLFILLMLFGFLQPLLLSVFAQASAIQWVGETGWWYEADNWDSLGQPQDGDQVWLTPTDAIDRYVYYSNTLHPDATLDFLWIGAMAPGNVTLDLGQDRLAVNQEYIGAPLFSPALVGTPFYGASGSAAITQTGGEHVVNNRLYVGYLGGTGTYSMIGGDLQAGSLEVGSEESKGEMNQSGGTVTAGGLFVGGYPLGDGVYNLSGGDLTTNETCLGLYGNGIFNQSGGTHETGHFVLGWDGSGLYNLSDGTLVAEFAEVGKPAGSYGEFNQTGGTFIVNDMLIVGSMDMSSVYNLNGGRLITNATIVGSCEGRFNQSGGAHVTENLLVDWSGYYSLIDGTLTADNLSIGHSSECKSGEFNYAGGNLNADITNFGTVTLSGDGTRIVNGNVINNGAWETTDTTVSYKGSFANSGTFNAENSIQYFDELSIIDSGSMTGSGEAPWFVKEQLSGLSISDGTVTNIFGEDGFHLFYNPWASGNDYLGGGDYDLIDGGTLTALDGIVCTDQYFMTDYLILGDTLTFDYWWEMDPEPTEGNFDVLFFNGTGWETFGWELSFDGSATEWQMATFSVPQWLRGEDVQIMFSLYDLGGMIDPTVYLRNIGSTCAPVPEPGTIILLGTGLLGLVGASRRNLVKREAGPGRGRMPCPANDGNREFPKFTAMQH